MFHLEGLKFDDGLSGSTPYTVAEMSGWGGGAELRREQIPHPAAHGKYALPGYLPGLEIAWKGLVLTTPVFPGDDRRQRHAVRALSALLAGGGLGRLSDGELWADVERVKIPPPVILVPGEIASYEVQLAVPDGRLYGEAREFPGGAVAYHYGDFPATPVHEVTGTTGGYTISGPDGKKFTVSSGPGSGVDRIDMASGRAYRNGVLLIGAVTRGDLWTIPPGVPGVVQTVNAGTLKTKLSDTFA